MIWQPSWTWSDHQHIHHLIVIDLRLTTQGHPRSKLKKLLYSNCEFLIGE